ncbi:hypothetical protein [Pokkaliibacter plantistimulans]|uniref:type II toxin-antitoxin system RelE family toxin n=1 Tax=Pokkaliibacter plantistimulans TaxID=1635171 RepID=UPI002D78F6A3|nr:hypothetical protein [Pokkaliibacter plantistimulans]
MTSRILATVAASITELGYRLVYQVEDEAVTLTVLTVGKRERREAYRQARQRAAE